MRLLVSRVDTDSIEHARFSDLPRWLSPGDLLVVNTSGTLNAALVGTSDGTATDSSCTSRRGCPETSGSSRCGARARSRRCRIATRARERSSSSKAAAASRCSRRIRSSIALDAPSRLWIAALELAEPVLPYLERFGSPIRYSYVPASWPESMYQTVFATEPGSAEMPSAGRPFTPELVTRLVSSGIQIAPLLLHTGVASLEDHEPPYEEFYRVPAETAERVNAARRAGHRVDRGRHDGRARARDGDRRRGTTSPGEGWTSLVIGPGTTAARGERHDHRLPRAARHASRDDRTGDRRRRRRPSRRRTSIAPIARRSRPDTCGTSSATRT